MKKKMKEILEPCCFWCEHLILDGCGSWCEIRRCGEVCEDYKVNEDRVKRCKELVEKQR